MGLRRAQTGNAWDLRGMDLPRATAMEKHPRQLGSLINNPVFHWLTQAARRGRLPRFGDLNPIALGLFSPLATLALLWGARSVSIIPFGWWILGGVVGLGVVGWRGVYSLMASGDQRGVLMHLPQRLLRDLRLTTTTQREVSGAVWGFELSARRFWRDLARLGALLAVMAYFCFTPLMPLLIPLVVWVVARMVMLIEVYPYHNLVAMARVLNRQAATVRRKKPLRGSAGELFRTALRPVLIGHVFWAVYFVPAMILFDELRFDRSIQTPLGGLGLVMAIAWGLIIGHVRSSFLKHDHPIRLEQIDKDARAIMSFYGISPDPEIKDHPLWGQIH